MLIAAAVTVGITLLLARPDGINGDDTGSPADEPSATSLPDTSPGTEPSEQQPTTSTTTSTTTTTTTSTTTTTTPGGGLNQEAASIADTAHPPTGGESMIGLAGALVLVAGMLRRAVRGAAAARP